MVRFDLVEVPTVSPIRGVLYKNLQIFDLSINTFFLAKARCIGQASVHFRQTFIVGLRLRYYITLHYIKSYLECQKSLGPLEHYMRLKE